MSGLRGWLLALAWILAGPAMAHKPSDSYLSLKGKAGSTDITVRWDIALRDLDYVLQLDRNGDGQLTWGEVRTRADDISRLATSRLSLSSAHQTCTLDAAGPLVLDRHSDGQYAGLSLVARGPRLGDSPQMRYSLLLDVDPSHRGLVQWQAPGASQPQPLVFGIDSAEQALGVQQAGVLETLRQYALDGIWHIWIGFDHILFLLALLLPSVLVWQGARWHGRAGMASALTQVVKVVTAFTLAHSITLTLAALGFISLPSRLVESVIAASVVLAALANLRGGDRHKPWVMAFGFGLIHGFGFASVLTDLGLSQGALAWALVGFNLGEELGKPALVAVFVPLAFWLRHGRVYQWGVLRGGSVLIAALASVWFVQRAFNLGV